MIEFDLMSNDMSDKIRKLSKSEQEAVFKKLDLYENLMHFWEIVDETLNVQKSNSAPLALAEWLEFLDVEYGSIRGYSKWAAITVSDVYQFKEFLFTLKARGERRCESTVEDRMMVIKRISVRLFNFGLLRQNPWIDVKIKTKVDRPYKAPMITDEQLEKLFDSIDRSTSMGKRDYAIFACLAGAGLRIGELEKLRCMDVQKTKKGRIYLKLIKTKNGNDYLQPLPEKFGDAVYEWQQEVLADCDLKAPLFVRKFKNGKIKQVGYEGLRKIIQRKFESLKLPFQTTHTFRVTAITKLLQNKIPLQDVQKFARHNSIVTTTLYNRDVTALDEETMNILDVL